MEVQNRLINEVLKDWGYRISEEDESHLIFRHQLNNVVCLFVAEDENFYTVGLTNFFEYEDKDELEVLKQCNEINKTKKQVKAYTMDDNRVVASSEFYCYDAKDLSKLLKSALDSLVTVKMYLTEIVINNK